MSWLLAATLNLCLARLACLATATNQPVMANSGWQRLPLLEMGRPAATRRVAPLTRIAAWYPDNPHCIALAHLPNRPIPRRLEQMLQSPSAEP